MIEVLKKKKYFLLILFYILVDFFEVSFGFCYRLKFNIRILEINVLNLVKEGLLYFGFYVVLEFI